MGGVPGQEWEGRAVWGEGSDSGLLLLPTCWGRTLCASGWERPQEGGWCWGPEMGGRDSWGRWGPGRRDPGPSGD